MNAFFQHRSKPPPHVVIPHDYKRRFEFTTPEFMLVIAVDRDGLLIRMYGTRVLDAKTAALGKQWVDEVMTIVMREIHERATESN